MKILAIDFSTDRCGVAVHDSEKGITHAERVGEGKSDLAQGLLEKCLGKAQIERKAIDKVAVVLGPGSFTGIRKAITIAQAWHMAMGIPVVSWRSSQLLAESLVRRSREDKTILGENHLLFDAQKKEFYQMEISVRTDGYGVLQPLKLVTKSDVLELLEQGKKVWSPDLRKSLPMVPNLIPDLVVVCELSLLEDQNVGPFELEPVSLRPVEFVKSPAYRDPSVEPDIQSVIHP